MFSLSILNPHSMAYTFEKLLMQTPTRKGINISSYTCFQIQWYVIKIVNVFLIYIFDRINMFKLSISTIEHHWKCLIYQCIRTTDWTSSICSHKKVLTYCCFLRSKQIKRKYWYNWLSQYEQTINSYWWFNWSNTLSKPQKWPSHRPCQNSRKGSHIDHVETAEITVT